jgi:hypothetical protein
MSSDVKRNSIQEEHTEYAELCIAAKKGLIVVDHPSFPGWRRLFSGKRSWTDEDNLIFTLDRLGGEYGHNIFYKKSTNTMLVVLNEPLQTVAHRFGYVTAVLKNRVDTQASVEERCKESLWYMSRLLDKNDNWILSFFRKLTRLLGYKNAMPKPNIVVTGFKEAGSVAEYVASCLGLEAITFSSCGLPSCKKINKKSKITRYTFSPNLANTLYSYEHGETFYFPEYDPTILRQGLLGRYRPTRGDILMINKSEDGIESNKKPEEHSLTTKFSKFYRRNVIPILLGLKDYCPEDKGTTCCDYFEYHAKKDRPISDSIVELGIRCARSTMEGMITALVFEHNPKLVTYWPNLLECINEKNPDDINSLVEVESPDLSM